MGTILEYDRQPLSRFMATELPMHPDKTIQIKPSVTVRAQRPVAIVVERLSLPSRISKRADHPGGIPGLIRGRGSKHYTVFTRAPDGLD